MRLALGSRAAGTEADNASPTQLALLAPDRNDAPNISEISGTPIGLWKIYSPTGSVADASLTISYDDLLANALGASQSSIELWTLNTPSDTWQLVDPTSFALDTVDHLVYGSADDFSYFAVAATPAQGADVEFIRAHQLAVINDQLIASPSGQSIGPGAGASQSVPEPVALPLLALGAGLLGRRRRSV